MQKSRLIYVSQFLSTWGDRMWSFAVSLFLMDLAPESLLLPAIFGLVRAATVLMFAPVVGNWIDKTPRLRGAQVPLVIQNSSVAVCAVILLVQKLSLGQGDGFKMFAKIASVVLGSLAQLASTATTIVIQKDWIVVIADGDSALLSKLNSMLRRIDLFTKLLAPLVCGQVMTLASLTVGCGFVAGWNIVSMVVEYTFLRLVYVRTPALAVKKGVNQTPPSSSENELELDDPSQEEEALVDSEENIDSERDDVMIINDTELQSNRVEERKENVSSCKAMFSFVLVIPQGWKLYMSQTITKAGLGLSCLYMTVLGFDAITISYAYNQCFSELLVGILVGCSAITGIISTFIFSPLSARFGVLRTGTIASIAQVVTLIPCVLSVFAPGSPFFIQSREAKADQFNSTLIPTASGLSNTSNYNFNQYLSTDVNQLNDSAAVLGNYSYSTNTSDPYSNGVFIKCLEGISPPPSYVSLSLLMTGTILARIGLWGFDLAITQLFQQQVLEQERGIVSGVQSSLNNLMDLVHFIFVISLPHPEQFGILILLSVFFVCLGHFLYALFSKQQSGSFCFGS